MRSSAYESRTRVSALRGQRPGPLDECAIELLCLPTGSTPGLKTVGQLPFPESPRFDGAAYLPFRDDERLTGQLLRIWRVVKDECWHTLPEIEALTGDPQASISAQLRHLRKPRFGGHTLEREYIDNGLNRYRILINPNAAAVMSAAPKSSHHKVAS